MEHVTLDSIWNRTSFEDIFIRAYLECALWCEELDASHDIDDFSPCAIESAKADCESFLNEHHDHILCLHQQCKYD